MRSTETFTEQARRAQITACAIDAIAELGYAQASVRKIADRAGVAMSVVLYHFGDKDSLIVSVVSECYRTLFEAMVPAVDAAPTAAGKLEAHIRAHLGYLRTHPAHQVAITEIGDGFRGKGGVRLWDLPVDREHDEARTRVELEAILRGGVESGEFRPLTPASIASAVRGAIGTAMFNLLVDPAFDLDGYADDLVDAFLRACAP
ncbi:Fatty acid metabolism regulator protein (plasmid) [Tsukamurella tyrosinosolvens]|uniref:DNA-binding transcriptional regulator, AcrR family n=1 Tax=Tsukamurella tyrosinosolvens TaxID=57704 RepID=A0A1H4T6X9_TSUTY|nr:TetR/AcrR family transcriptional regulator [Tsukamurella tyrosinosolvens]KXO93277.1 TetR family transcriptional regulator [Tsukamurella tyrosinosolvens]SEC52127.1 DNA-binding transcriptional regulator, AcrR family [Tsukamurella tyrosinosolvens]VEH88565.1 Fatty acid metabolism regulator protein [Tsukamurella tyrosinosolvens]